ncbi:hypothetical protein K8P10_000608 [Leucobacter sp. Psy1]|uniref:hypothetical protein n=1 Tax=Leucobacter sp. Psy1 TaxID=2875729 RepID=UPI001CD4BA13|nr:hypothetical protein [Leucobacter sp. Psy1]UBH05097.1 hypothetical protein K8P10_000608 [Leucobacter sp. Psy1]
MLKPPRAALAAALGAALVVGAPFAAGAAAAPLELQEEQKFGSGAARSGGRAIDLVGDHAAVTNAVGSAMDFTHRTESGVWETQTVEAPQADAQFGEAVVFDDDAGRAFVSAPRAQSVHVYERSGENDWSLQRTLVAPAKPDRVSDYGSDDRNFAEALDFSDGILAVGVPNATVDRKSHAGFVFTVDVDAPGEPQWVPHIPERVIGDSITGQSVALDGDRLAVSAIQNREDHVGVRAARVGGLYLWDLAGNTEPRFRSMPKEDEKVCLSNAGSGGTFGVSVSFFGETLAVGSPHEITYTADTAEAGCTGGAVARGETTQGAVYFFDGELNQLGGKLTPPAQSMSFGYSTAVDGSTLYAYSDHAPRYTGEVHAYDLDALSLSGTGDENRRQHVDPLRTLTASDATPNQLFGYQAYGQGLRADSGRLLVGSTMTGAAYAFAPAAAQQPIALAIAEVQDSEITLGASGVVRARVTPGSASLEGAHAIFTVGDTGLAPVPIEGDLVEAEIAANAFPEGEHEVTVRLVNASGQELAAETTPGILTVVPRHEGPEGPGGFEPDTQGAAREARVDTAVSSASSGTATPALVTASLQKEKSEDRSATLGEPGGFEPAPPVSGITLRGASPDAQSAAEETPMITGTLWGHIVGNPFQLDRGYIPTGTVDIYWGDQHLCTSEVVPYDEKMSRWLCRGVSLPAGQTVTLKVVWSGDDNYDPSEKFQDFVIPDLPEPVNPGTENPGTENPGTEDPGTENPGTENPGTENPGTENPGTENPGTENPGTENPVEPKPTEPTTPVDPTEKPSEKPGATKAAEPRQKLAQTGGGAPLALGAVAVTALLAGGSMLVLRRRAAAQE